MMEFDPKDLDAVEIVMELESGQLPPDAMSLEMWRAANRGESSHWGA